MAEDVKNVMVGTAGHIDHGKTAEARLLSESARMKQNPSTSTLRIGWAQTDITPDEPVSICGQFHARVSEGVMDPITATAMALESDGASVVFVSCDLAVIPDVLHDAVRARLRESVDPEDVIMHATHTHTGPEVRLPDLVYSGPSCGHGVDLAVMPAEKYLEFASERIVRAVEDAWALRAPGKVAYGLGYAVVGRNRRWVSVAGQSTMYGNTNTPDFSHIEGYEDHSVNVLATYDIKDSLTGVVVNVPCSSQVDENAFQLSADYWHETRQELRRRLGKKLFVLAQCSPAGDQSPHPIYEKRALQRMWNLAGWTERQVIAHRISDAVTETLGFIKDTAADAVVLRHYVERMDLPMTALTEEQAKEALGQAEVWAARYQEEKRKLESAPELKNEPRWYVRITRAYRRSAWYSGVADRFKRQGTQATRPAELHFVRLGDVAFATNPFEYYLDFGVHIKCRSKATQTFLVQLAGGGTYVPSLRSTQGGGYGSIPASNPLGPVAGRLVAEKSVEVINGLFDEGESSRKESNR